MDLSKIAEDLRNYFYDDHDVDLQVELDDNEINVYLDLPSTENYDNHIEAIENYFRDSDNDIDDFDIDGDYEGTITLTYVG